MTAVFTVVLGHLAEGDFFQTHIFIFANLNLASDAVIIFFVISGVVIALAAERDGTLERFAFHRLTRLWSVLLPAIILTIAFDAIGARLAPEVYELVNKNDEHAFAYELLRTISLTNGWHGTVSSVTFGSNIPLWSLSYEAAFYLIFAIALFCKGLLRLFLIGVIVYLVGLPVILLMPSWLLGVLVLHVKPRRVSDPVVGWTYAIVGLAILFLLSLLRINHDLRDVTEQLFGTVNYRYVLQFADEFLWNAVIGICLAMHLVGVRRLTSQSTPAAPKWFGKSVRWTAGASFSIYVVHYPTLHLLKAILPEAMPFYDGALLLFTLAICFCFAAVFERPIKPLRRRLRPYWLHFVGWFVATSTAVDDGEKKRTS